MRTWILGIALLFLAAPVAAQDASMSEFTDDEYRARVAFGDIPISDDTEPAGAWNVAEYFRFVHDGNQTDVAVPTDGTLTCTCGNYTQTETGISVGSDEPAGTYHVKLLHAPVSNPAFAVMLAGAMPGEMLVAYVPEGHTVFTNAEAQGTLPCTSAACDIHTFEIPADFWMTLQPTGTITPIGPVDDDDAFEWLAWILAFAAGIILWAFLVQRGYVQKRRKQEVQKAAHVEAAEVEGKEILAARKRVIMAGLKDLEKAKMNKEVDDQAYDLLKAELKREAVVIMRALETAE